MSNPVNQPNGEALKPCPFCGASLTPNNNQADTSVNRYGTHYDHPPGLCFLAGTEVTPSQVVDWNTRAQPSQAPAEPVAWRHKERVNNEFDTEWILTSNEPADGVRVVAKEPLYTTPQVVPEGMVMVPIEPTPEMLEAGARSIIDGQENRPGTSWADEAGFAFKAMLKALGVSDRG